MRVENRVMGFDRKDIVHRITKPRNSNATDARAVSIVSSEMVPGVEKTWKRKHK